MAFWSTYFTRDERIGALPGSEALEGLGRDRPSLHSKERHPPPRAYYYRPPPHTCSRPLLWPDQRWDGFVYRKIASRARGLRIFKQQSRGFICATVLSQTISAVGRFSPYETRHLLYPGVQSPNSSLRGCTPPKGQHASAKMEEDAQYALHCIRKLIYTALPFCIGIRVLQN